MRRLSTMATSPIAWLVAIGVLLVGLVDWAQGAPPEGVVSVPAWVGLSLFVAAIILSLWSSAAVGEEATPTHPAFIIGPVAATVAALFGDPTYAVLLFAIPLVTVGRRIDWPARRGLLVGLFVLVVVLVALEDSSWGGNDLEATLAVFVALLATASLGSALGQLDRARAGEADRARAEERQHLAAELHDSVGHGLLAASIQLTTARALWEDSPQESRGSMELARRAVAAALDDTRFAVDTIRSERGTFSLTDALTELKERATSPSLDVSVAVSNTVDELDQVIQVTLYRVAQEALTNALRHADASAVSMSCTVGSEEVILAIVDDGVGFDVNGEHSAAGLRSLEDRVVRIGGDLDIDSQLGRGTSVRATVGFAR